MRTWVCFLLLLGLSATVRAQGSGAIFVEGAVFGDHDPTRHGQTNSTYLPGVFMSNEANEVRTITYGALFGGHAQPHKNVDVAFLAGLSSAVPESRASGRWASTSPFA